MMRAEACAPQGPPDGRIAVTCAHPTPQRPPLALGLCVAYARRELPPPLFDLEPRFASSAAELERLLAPGAHHVVLFSNYIWNVEANLELSRRAKELDPDCTTIHGGPSTPAYPGACEDFLRRERHVDFAVRGEGEQTLVELLRALARGDARSIEIAGVSVLVGDRFVQHPTRERAVDLDRFPSPYLTGVLDGYDPGSWEAATIETNRGCPYGCTFCDWGSATLQKLRTFDLERLRAEIDWIADRQIPQIWIADANFGILPRDVEIAHAICGAKRRTGFPRRVIVNYSKNTHKHLVEIVELFVDVGLVHEGTISLQTRDPHTLDAVRRRNIKTPDYDKLRDVFARKGLPLATHLMLALPGSTVRSFKEDLRHYFDEPINVLIFHTAMLPNSPMADPAYRAEHKIEVDENALVLSTSSMTAEEIGDMTVLARLFRGTHGYGILRYPLRWLQWEWGLDPIDLLHTLTRDLKTSRRFPPLRELIDPGTSSLDLLTTHVAMREQLRRAAGWEAFHGEFASWVSDRYGVEGSSAFRSVLRAQTAVMPAFGRSFPDTVTLEHDVAAWYADRLTGGHGPLAGYGPGLLEVEDPWSLSNEPVVPYGPGRPNHAWELKSALSVARGEGILTLMPGADGREDLGQQPEHQAVVNA